MNFRVASNLLISIWASFLLVSCMSGKHRSYEGIAKKSNFHSTTTEKTLTAIKQEGIVLLQESFDDSYLGHRGWYDGGTENATVVIDSERQNHTLEVRFRKGSKKPQNGPLRHVFNDAEVLYFRYKVKYADNWSWTKHYGPHEFYFLTNANRRWVGPAKTRLTLYVEVSKGRPKLAIQDAENINVNRINENLVDKTESRAVAGCNGNVGEGRAGCYQIKGGWLNGKSWASSADQLQNNRWYEVEVFVQMNSIQGGKGIPDGTIGLWLDEKLVLYQNDVLLRTGTQDNLKFNQFMVGPWFHGGVPHDQRFWIDDLLIKTINKTSLLKEGDAKTSFMKNRLAE